MNNSPTQGSFSRRKGSSHGRSKFGGNNNERRNRFAGNRRSGPGAFSRFGSRSRFRSRDNGPRLDYSKFINKATVTEEVEKFVPEHSFKDFHIDERLKQTILDIGFDLPTPIQDRAIPHVLKGADVVGIASTGTGKTAAFLIPLIHKVLLNPKEEVLVVVPTRELALQIQDELRRFTVGMKIYSVCCVGGAPIGKQINSLRYVNQFVIGTPGRLKDLIERKKLDLSNFKTVVLDEADRMLDMGFVNDMRFMMDRMSKERQTLFFSATLSKEIEHLIHDFLNNPVRISVKTRDTSSSVDQDVVRIQRGEDKLNVLHTLLEKEDFSKVIIFGKTKHGVERLSQALIERGFKAASIHGDKNQGQRQRALASFKNDYVQILVATDVAARGLDIPDVSHVINYELPATFEDYVHRIGRTGRGKSTGKALTFIG